MLLYFKLFDIEFLQMFFVREKNQKMLNIIVLSCVVGLVVRSDGAVMNDGLIEDATGELRK